MDQRRWQCGGPRWRVGKCRERRVWLCVVLVHPGPGVARLGHVATACRAKRPSLRTFCIHQLVKRAQYAHSASESYRVLPPAVVAASHACELRVPLLPVTRRCPQPPAPGPMHATVVPIAVPGPTPATAMVCAARRATPPVANKRAPKYGADRPQHVPEPLLSVIRGHNLSVVQSTRQLGRPWTSPRPRQRPHPYHV